MIYNANGHRITVAVSHFWKVGVRSGVHCSPFTKVRYRGLAKNATRAFAALMLANLYLLRRRLVAA